MAGKPDAAARLATRKEALSLHHLVLREMQARAGGLPVDNGKSVCAGFGNDAAFNAGIRRHAGDAACRR